MTGAPSLPAAFRLQATVRAHHETFGAIPRYLARISDSAPEPFVFPADLASSANNVYIEPRLEILIDSSLTDHTKFTASVTLLVYTPGGVTFNPDLGQVAAVFAKRWSISWVGIEG